MARRIQAAVVAGRAAESGLSRRPRSSPSHVRSPTPRRGRTWRAIPIRDGGRRHGPGLPQSPRVPQDRPLAPVPLLGRIGAPFPCCGRWDRRAVPEGGTGRGLPSGPAPHPRPQRVVQASPRHRRQEYPTVSQGGKSWSRARSVLPWRSTAKMPWTISHGSGGIQGASVRARGQGVRALIPSRVHRACSHSGPQGNRKVQIRFQDNPVFDITVRRF